MVGRATDVLVVHANELSPPTRKVAAALSLGVPIVGEAWLDACVAARDLVPFDAHRLEASATARHASLVRRVLWQPALSLAAVVVGIARAIALDVFTGLVLWPLALAVRWPALLLGAASRQALASPQWRRALAEQAALALGELLLLAPVLTVLDVALLAPLTGVPRVPSAALGLHAHAGTVRLLFVGAYWLRFAAAISVWRHTLRVYVADWQQRPLALVVAMPMLAACALLVQSGVALLLGAVCLVSGRWPASHSATAHFARWLLAVPLTSDGELDDASLRAASSAARRLLADVADRLADVARRVARPLERLGSLAARALATLLALLVARPLAFLVARVGEPLAAVVARLVASIGGAVERLLIAADAPMPAPVRALVRALSALGSALGALVGWLALLVVAPWRAARRASALMRGESTRGVWSDVGRGCFDIGCEV